jgi:hypothetical protein
MTRKRHTRAPLVKYDVRANAILREIDSGTDRVAALVAAGYVEDLLEQLLAKALLPPPTNRAPSLLGGSEPLATLSARINMVYYLGIVSVGFWRVLESLRKLRNDFADKVEPASLDDQPYSDHVRAFVEPFKNDRVYRSYHRLGVAVLGPGYQDPFAGQDLRRQFRASVGILIVRLWELIEKEKAPARVPAEI